jgi:hypothetical protein
VKVCCVCNACKVHQLSANQWYTDAGFDDNPWLSAAFCLQAAEAEGQSGNHLLCRITLQPEELDESHSFCSSPSEDGGGAIDHDRDDRT